MRPRKQYMYVEAIMGNGPMEQLIMTFPPTLDHWLRSWTVC
jgi:hypothetical protein